MKKIFQYGENEFRIEETKSVKVVSTANLKVLEKEIMELEAKIEEMKTMLMEEKDLLKEIKKVEK